MLNTQIGNNTACSSLCILHFQLLPHFQQFLELDGKALKDVLNDHQFAYVPAITNAVRSLSVLREETFLNPEPSVWVGLSRFASR